MTRSISPPTLIRAGLAFLVLLWLSAPGYALSDDLLRTVAISTSFGPPTTPQFLFPSINDLGDTAFTSASADSAFAQVWMNSPVNGTRLVAGRGNVAPGIAPVAAFDTTGLPFINDAGRVSTRGRVIGPGITELNDDGLWSENSTGVLSLVAREGSVAPGNPPGSLYDFVGSNLMNNAGHIAFGELLRGPGISTSNERAIWWSDNAGNTQLVVQAGQPAPGTINDFAQPNPSQMAINDSDTLVFNSTLSASAGSGIWSWNPSTGLNLLARRNDPVAGVPGISTLGNLFNPRINNAGDIAFFDANNRIWVKSAVGSLRLVARTGEQAPGTASGVNFSALNSTPVVNAAGRVATYAQVTGPGVVAANNEGIWREAASGLQLVARTGDQAPGAPAGVVFSDILAPTMNASGQVAFTAIVSGPGITGQTDRGIWAQQPDGNLRLVIREGDTIDVDDGPGIDLRTVAVLDAQNSFFSSGNEDGNISMFNDLGQMVFVANFFDGSSGVFVSDIGAIPEPGVWALLAVGGLVANLRRFRRR